VPRICSTCSVVGTFPNYRDRVEDIHSSSQNTIQFSLHVPNPIALWIGGSEVQWFDGTLFPGHSLLVCCEVTYHEGNGLSLIAYSYRLGYHEII